ncbi:lamin tail domain-containing protein [Streptomyces sp. IMTB 2501]|uniref:lamin tail domain-containing protein n=1 Tax=Streptomyces sp. IMTB 2501 TaxID=1776340 RepID=UPI0021163843|nr:lamin tail domain-containing protein [Streptomyces sp. IMTB 2501]
MSVSSSVRRLTAVAAVAAATVGVVAPSAVAAGRAPVRTHGVVYISGVQHKLQGRDDRSNRALNKQWVAVTNSSRRAVNLDSWKLSDLDGHSYTFRHVRLAGRATVRVHTGVGRNTATDVYQDLRARVWDVNADAATLRDARGRIIDAVSWGRRTAKPARTTKPVHAAKPLHAAKPVRRDGAGLRHGGVHHQDGARHHDDHARGHRR